MPNSTRAIFSCRRHSTLLAEKWKSNSSSCALKTSTSRAGKRLYSYRSRTDTVHHYHLINTRLQSEYSCGFCEFDFGKVALENQTGSIEWVGPLKKVIGRKISIEKNGLIPGWRTFNCIRVPSNVIRSRLVSWFCFGGK